MRNSLLILFLFAALLGQESLQSLERKDQKLKEEVEDLKSAMANFNQNKDNILYQLKASDYNIRLSTKLLQGIETRLKKLIIFIDRNKKNVRSLVSEQEQLKKQYAARLVDAYKTPPITQLDILFNAKTVDEYLRFTKYREVIDSEETRLLKELATKQRKTEAAQKSLQRDINKQVAEKEKQKKQLLKLAADKKKQKSLFKSISSSISKTKKAISEKEKSRLNMRRMIKDLTTSSKVRSNKFIPNKKFSKNKGKFPWPVKGKVTRRFGKIKHPKFAIYEQNDGIDISARKGSIVSNLHEGVVLNVFYQLGAGNTIIIDHGYEIFTVYTHLEDIVVKVNQHISSGAAIGTVGNSGTIDGKAKLHFEIWVKNKAVNPAKWLR